ncbi:MAG: proline dehydrogenase [Chlamydiae bacterium RIFCSPHIGHO2_12_FULL_49_9]|nr:MAG: proline dehydrogenase [Chlamydiae bacterium RIFCSPHIGHO2_12_FULL_49_9]
MNGSAYLDEAVEILTRVKGTPLSIDERKKLAIDLAALMIKEASRVMTGEEKRIQRQLSRLMKDSIGKAFTTAMTDQCFRSSSNLRVADQMIYLLSQLGIPQYLDWFKRMELLGFKTLGAKISQFLVPLATKALRKETERVILPGEKALLAGHLQERRKEGVRLNLNHLGEAILSEAEAKKRLHIYLEDLKNPDIDYISVKISTIFSQINLLSFDETAEKIGERLKLLYRAAMDHPKHKFINLDMEEYRDLHLTVKVFKALLDEREFRNLSAGIVLQAYLPDSHNVQKELTEWAKNRVREGGAPIKIRIVKGANLAMEQFEASLKGWPQAPYTTKLEVDANYKRMVLYGCIPENARAVHLGVASHNLFDIAFAMLARLENRVEPYVCFEMLEGMADAIRRVVQGLTGDMLLYCPVATKEEFQHAIAYLIRRLDENTGPENFLRHVFGLRPGSESWEGQSSLFLQSCEELERASLKPRRGQNRLVHPQPSELGAPFENEADTDFSLAQNRKWAEEIAHHWKHAKISSIPLVINGEEVKDNEEGVGFNPSNPNVPLYTYTKAHAYHVEKATESAKEYEKEWGKTSVEHRSRLLFGAAQKLRERRGELIGVMMIDGGKIISESDPEVSEAIDFAEYYRRRLEKIDSMKEVAFKPKGTVVVTPPWNFPCAIPAGGMLAALAAGNCVILKPASDTVLVAWHLINALWDAGIPKKALQFLACSGEDVGKHLIEDKKVNAVILTGGTATARSFMKMRPGLDLAAETGGKNAMIITALSDRDLAIKDLLQSAFGHAGQKCSAASLAILEKEVYDDPHFRRSLMSAAMSWKVGPAWDLSTKIGPLIHEPKGVLKRALTTLEDGEEWLLEPKQDAHNPNLWSPGIKIGVRPGGFTHMTELFGPVLGIMRADDLRHAIEIANAVPYGLTTGLQSLDEREQAVWIQEIEAGNLYVNRGTTGAIVRRQPFGGTKASSFGGGAKAGGPNYIAEFMELKQVDLPKEKHSVNDQVNSLTGFLEKLDLKADQLGLWTASVSNYAYWWKRLRQDRDPTKIVGQDNFFRYIPRKKMALRVQRESSRFDALRVIAASLTCGAGLEVSWEGGEMDWLELSLLLPCVEESEKAFLERVSAGRFERVRMVEKAPESLVEAASQAPVYLIDKPVLATGRFELLHYLREVSLSIDYHRYGNLGLREGELRKPIF